MTGNFDFSRTFTFKAFQLTIAYTFGTSCGSCPVAPCAFLLPFRIADIAFFLTLTSATGTFYIFLTPTPGTFLPAVIHAGAVTSRAFFLSFPVTRTTFFQTLSTARNTHLLAFPFTAKTSFCTGTTTLLAVGLSRTVARSAILINESLATALRAYSPRTIICLDVTVR